MATNGRAGDFAAVKSRLEEIAHAVEDSGVSLDEALDLYEEAVKLGLEASNLLETGIVVDDDALAEDAAGQADEAGQAGEADASDSADGENASRHASSAAL